jgi:hypothetical protein
VFFVFFLERKKKGRTNESYAWVEGTASPRAVMKSSTQRRENVIT